MVLSHNYRADRLRTRRTDRVAPVSVIARKRLLKSKELSKATFKMIYLRSPAYSRDSTYRQRRRWNTRRMMGVTRHSLWILLTKSKSSKEHQGIRELPSRARCVCTYAHCRLRQTAFAPVHQPEILYRHVPPTLAFVSPLYAPVCSDNLQSGCICRFQEGNEANAGLYLRLKSPE
ncbi:hypothetical protein KQX54_020158 [Cotesia glomerata]|uniref:Uncharacterized protein n=1 Tax=Cotesia glomerata TaxID=32391 RepID=A0AAV7IGW9_COTGL|nr:hypothetical protein KQX54_020158 [Cotesia glomerata]